MVECRVWVGCDVEEGHRDRPKDAVASHGCTSKVGIHRPALGHNPVRRAPSDMSHACHGWGTAFGSCRADFASSPPLQLQGTSHPVHHVQRHWPDDSTWKVSAHCYTCFALEMPIHCSQWHQWIRGTQLVRGAKPSKCAGPCQRVGRSTSKAQRTGRRDTGARAEAEGGSKMSGVATQTGG